MFFFLYWVKDLSLESDKYPEVLCGNFSVGNVASVYIYQILTIRFRSSSSREGSFHEFSFRLNFLLFSVVPEEVYTWPDI